MSDRPALFIRQSRSVTTSFYDPKKSGPSRKEILTLGQIRKVLTKKN